MHQLFSAGIRTGLVVAGVIGFSFYCFSNYVWDLPHTDFRPFKENVNVAAQKMAEEEAETSVQILAYEMTNKSSGEVVNLPYEQFMKEFKNYPKEEWEYEQIKSEPAIPRTKISDFDISDVNGNNQTDNILSYPEYSFMIIAYKLYDAGKTVENEIVLDTIYQVDTVQAGDSLQLVQSIKQIDKRQVSRDIYNWKQDYLKPWKIKVNPAMEAAKKDGTKVFAITGFAGAGKLNSFRDAAGSDYPFFEADDILLKTIVRSNPGVVLLHNGSVVKKWHYSKFPGYEEIKDKYMK